MRTAFENIDAVAYYGSLVRGDRDRFSDRDLLLVSDDEDALDTARVSLSMQGYSCACYDWGKLRLLASRKALFIQHLKQESRVIVDKGDKLKSLLNDYSPAVSYSEQIGAARDLVSLTEYFPNTPYGIGWALDVLTIGFRNLAILTLANEGKYVFSFSALAAGLRRLGMVDSTHERAFVSLRKYKSCFRTRQFSILPPKNRVFELQRIIGETFDANLEPKAVSEELFHDYCLHSRKAVQTAQWYLKARLYEGAFLMLNRPSKARDGKYWSRFQTIEEAIASPGCYSALFSNHAQNLHGEIVDLTKEVGLRVP